MQVCLLNQFLEVDLVYSYQIMEIPKLCNVFLYLLKTSPLHYSFFLDYYKIMLVFWVCGLAFSLKYMIHYNLISLWLWVFFSKNRVISFYLSFFLGVSLAFKIFPPDPCGSVGWNVILYTERLQVDFDCLSWYISRLWVWSPVGGFVKGN